MTIEMRSALEPDPSSVPSMQHAGAAVCALIDTKFEDSSADLAAIAENIERLRRQLLHLRIQEIGGLGDIPAGCTVVFLRSDVVFELQGLRAIAQRLNVAAQIGGLVAAVHCDAGHAAAALSKFRRGETKGWSPFGVVMHRLGQLMPARSSVSLGFLTSAPPSHIARAMVLEAPGVELESKRKYIWQRTPGLDRIVRFPKLVGLQKEAHDAFGLTPGSWQAFGLLLGVMMVCFGAVGWGALGAAFGILAAVILDLAERSINVKSLRASNSAIAPSLQALLVSLTWLFVVFAVPVGPVAQAAAFVLCALPLAFIACLILPDPVSVLRPLAFGVYGQVALATLTVVGTPLGFGIVILPLAALTVLLAIILQTLFGLLPKVRKVEEALKPQPIHPSLSEPAE